MKKQARHKKKQSYKAVARVLVTLLILITGLIAYYSIRGGDRTLLMVFHSEKQVADTSGAWNLILVDRDHYIPANYQVELTELSNGEKVDSRIYPELQQMFDDARAAGLALFVREGYRTTKEEESGGVCCDSGDERASVRTQCGYQRGYIQMFIGCCLSVAG